MTPLAVSVMRKELQDLHFSGGITIPKGTVVVAAARAMHNDEAIYSDPHVFNPWRFSDLRQGSDTVKYQFVSASADYVPFGLGKHAWSVTPTFRIFFVS